MPELVPSRKNQPTKASADKPGDETMSTATESLVEKLARQLGLSDAQVTALLKNYESWEEPLRDFEAAIKRSEAVTEDDLAIRINVRDYD